MKIPNIDGKYTTRDGSVQITVTRKEIEIDIGARPAEVNIIDEDDRRVPQKRKSGGDSALRKMGKGFTDLSYMLIGG